MNQNVKYKPEKVKKIEEFLEEVPIFKKIIIQEEKWVIEKLKKDVNDNWMQLINN
jgi:hypothetical protein